MNDRKESTSSLASTISFSYFSIDFSENDSHQTAGKTTKGSTQVKVIIRLFYYTIMYEIQVTLEGVPS